MTGRIISRYEGKEPGPLLICIGGMHGNESAGIEAIQEVFNLLSVEPEINPSFHYRGVMLGLRGNLEALQRNQRFLNRDLNRMMIPDEIARIQQLPPGDLMAEDRECLELIETIEKEIKNYQPDVTLILDLHTTTADGGIFTIAAEDDMSRVLAKGLHAPVVLGIAERLNGTTINYFNRPESNCYCIVFEAGQHQDPFSKHRSVAAIVNCMRSIGAVDSKDVDHSHDGLLINFSSGLPKITRLVYHYRIQPDEQFIMNPGYRNFQPVKAGQALAINQEGGIYAPVNGMVLMPKYQSQGDDGFFIVEPVEI